MIIYARLLTLPACCPDDASAPREHERMLFNFPPLLYINIARRGTANHSACEQEP